MIDWNFTYKPPEPGWYLLAYSQIRNKRKKTWHYITDIAYWHGTRWSLQGEDEYFDRIDAWAYQPEHPLESSGE